MNTGAIVRARLQGQGLSDPRFTTPEAVVRHLGAMQAQEFAYAKWSIGQRTSSLTEADVAAAVADGRILRTHLLRPTWHFVAREDIRWILNATTHRVHQLNGTMYRQLELNDDLLTRSLGILEREIGEHGHRTRAELGAALAGSGIVADGMRLGYIVHFAELEALICSGAPRGKQQTYALISERAPNAVELPPEEALPELTRRYVLGHGPVTERDLAGWASLTLAAVRRGLEMVAGELASADVDGVRYWYSPELVTPTPAPMPDADLIQVYDEYVMGYFESRGLMGGGQAVLEINSAPFTHVLLIDSTMAGKWQATARRKELTVEVQAHRILSPTEWDAVARAATAFGLYHDLPVTFVRA